VKDPNWPPKIGEFIVNQDVQLISPFPFIPEITPGTVGPIFEMRYVQRGARLAPRHHEAVGREDRRAGRSCLPIVPRGRDGVRSRPTGSCTSGRTRAWISGSPCGSRRGKAGVWPPPGGGDELLRPEQQAHDAVVVLAAPVVRRARSGGREGGRPKGRRACLREVSISKGDLCNEWPLSALRLACLLVVAVLAYRPVTAANVQEVLIGEVLPLTGNFREPRPAVSVGRPDGRGHRQQRLSGSRGAPRPGKGFPGDSAEPR
jgi:hypothetical protein